MNKRILLVDDDENLLRAMKRNLRRDFDLHTALGGEEGLRAVEKEGPFAVIVSDMRMPRMDGIQFLEAARRIAPDSVRMMLTGNADLDTAIAAVNEGHVFRFITKPCPADAMVGLLTTGIRQYQLVTAERQLLEGTLQGAIRVCLEILSAADPRSYGHAERVREIARPIAVRLDVGNPWELEVAAMLARIGNATIPPVVMVRHRHERALTGVERDMLARVPEIGHNLLQHIPRMQNVARIVRYSEKRFDGEGLPRDAVAGTDLPLGSRVLKFASDFAELEAKGETRLRALEILRQRTGWYDPEVVQAAAAALCPAPTPGADAAATNIAVPFAALALGDLLTCNVETQDGVLLVQAGTILTGTLLERLRNFAKLNDLREPIQVERAAGRPVASPVSS